MFATPKSRRTPPLKVRVTREIQLTMKKEKMLKWIEKENQRADKFKVKSILEQKVSARTGRKPDVNSEEIDIFATKMTTARDNNNNNQTNSSATSNSNSTTNKKHTLNSNQLSKKLNHHPIMKNRKFRKRLEKVENKLYEDIKINQETLKANKNKPSLSSNNVGGKVNNESSPSIQETTLEPHPPISSKPTLNVDELQDWRYIEAYQALKASEKAQNEKEQLRQSNNAYKNKLELQMKELEARRQHEEEERQRFRDEQKTAVEIWQTEQERLRKEIMMKHEEEKQVRLQMIRANEKSRKQALVDKLAREKKEVAAAREALKLEEERAIKKKIDEKARLEKIAVENEVNRQVKERIKELAAIEDARLMQEYKEKMDREEAARAKAFAERLAKLEKTAKRFAEDGAGKEAEERDKALELKILTDARVKEAELAALDKAKAEKRRKDGLELYQEYKHVIDKKQELDANLKQMDLQMAKKTLKEVANSIKKDQNKQVMRREEAVQYQNKLLQQMQEDQKKREDSLKPMSSTEFQLNKDFLAGLEEDPNLLTRVQAVVKGEIV